MFKLITPSSLMRLIVLAALLRTSCLFLSAQSGSYVNITTYGAKGDAVTHGDGAIAAGSTSFTSASSTFSSADVGKFVEITGVGTNANMTHGAGTACGILTTTIQSFQSTHMVTLAAAATTTTGCPTINLPFTYGTDNTTAFQNAYSAGVPLSVPSGSYLVVAGTQMSSNPISGGQALVITGAGPDSKILSDNQLIGIAGSGTSGTSITNLDLEPIAKFTVVRLSTTENPTSPAAPASNATCAVPASGTPILLDIFGTGNGIEPPTNLSSVYTTCWPTLSAFQQYEYLGPKIIVKGGDHVSISNISGDQIVIELQDVTNSALQNNDFTGGGNGASGCLGMVGSTSGTQTNIEDAITGNNVRYCSYSNIFWGNAVNLLVANNISQFAGESGFKNFAPWSVYVNSIVTVANNLSKDALFDGFDLSTDYPHSAQYPVNSTATGNQSLYNVRTGYYSDGSNWNFTANSAASNGLEGFFLDYTSSTISGNTSRTNNLQKVATSNQFSIDLCCATSDNIIENNFIDITDSGIPGYAMQVGTSSVGCSNCTASNNVVQEQPGELGLWFKIAPVNSSGNTGLANTFAGNVTINGNLQVNGYLAKTSGSFKIDHPLDPLNKYLIHSFVESPDMMNVYNGIVELDDKGQAEVSLPIYFEALNYNFRYQLTSLGRFERIYVAREIKDNKFLIAGGHLGTRVSWQVTGIRKDPYAEAHRIQPEVDKPDNERGHYLHPEVYEDNKK